MMWCELGIEISKNGGGRYSGPGIARMIGGIRSRLEADDLTGDRDPDDKGPHIFFNYNSEYKSELDKGQHITVSLMFEEDNRFDLLLCGGYGKIKDWARDNTCDECPYLRK